MILDVLVKETFAYWLVLIRSDRYSTIGCQFNTVLQQNIVIFIIHI